MTALQSGQLYIGGIIDAHTRERSGEPVIYDAHHLTTHGVIVGMTGSGKTGLGMVMLEEALMANIPTLIIDPKGDMGNLALRFPDFQTADFSPWVDPAVARREGISTEEHAARTAVLWKNGLASWDVSNERIRSFKNTIGVTIYTPGSSAGIPLNIIGSLKAPEMDWASDAELIRDEIESFVSSLLLLANIDADPVSSREHVLLSNLIETSWRNGMDLDLEKLIIQIQSPPLRKLGVFELDTFFPANERMKLAMRLNNLIASPSFASWMEGPPLDIQSMLYTKDNKPRAAIVYLPHLSEQERQFIVTLLLSKMVSWIRKQPGTSDLRALIYMDEVFGFCPPSAQPPSKRPILTILKQARAHGVGMLLSTQNPVDLDYMAVSNSGTWMIGRLQTERDKARILEGLKSASGGTDINEFDRLIGGLGKREFLLHSSQGKKPQIFTTRWAISYLRGPLTRDEVGKLMRSQILEVMAATQASLNEGPALAANESPVMPRVADGTPVYYLDPAAPWANRLGASPTGKRLHAAIVARIHLIFDEKKAHLNHKEEWEAIFYPLNERLDMDEVINVDYDDRDLQKQVPDEPIYLMPQAPIDKSSYFKDIGNVIKESLYRDKTLQLFYNPGLRTYSRIGETEKDFITRCEALADDQADGDAAKLKQRFETRIDMVKDRISDAERRVRELDTDTQTRSQQEWIAGAGELLSAFLGGRKRTRSLAGAASRRAQTRRTRERLQSAQERLNDQQEDLDELEDNLAQELEEIQDKWQAVADDIQAIDIGLEKTDITIDEVALVWVPRE